MCLFLALLLKEGIGYGFSLEFGTGRFDAPYNLGNMISFKTTAYLRFGTTRRGFFGVVKKIYFPVKCPRS